MARDWRFYGRQGELEKLNQFINSGEKFSTLAIRGRRKVGKTALINHYRQIHQDGADRRRLIVCPLQRPVNLTHCFHETLLMAVNSADPALLDGYIPHDNPHTNFTAMALYILESGHILVLDEFQRIGYDGSKYLESVFQAHIDRLGDISAPRPEGWHPRLIVMGSEQQKLWEMFTHPTAPLYQQIWDVLHLKPWNFNEFKETAKDQGWDGNPNRLLTLWTAYNGLPGHWQRFAREKQLSDFTQISDDADWTRQFLAMEDSYRKLPDGPFHSQLEVELRASDLAIIRWLASRPSGYSINTDLKDSDHCSAFAEIKTALQQERPDEEISDDNISEKVSDAIQKRMSGEHLGLLAAHSPLNSEKSTKWSVSDNFAQFQLKIFNAGEIDEQWTDNENEITEMDRLAEMRALEGLGLESFAAHGFRELFDTGTDIIPSNQARRIWIRTHVERKGITGDLDLMIIHQEKHPTSSRNHDGNRNFWIGSAKRTASEFYRAIKDKCGGTTTALQRDLKRVDLFLQPLDCGNALTREHFKKKWRYEINFVVISRTFTRSDREEVTKILKYHQQNSDCDNGVRRFFAMTIDDMMSGRGPQSLERVTKT
ncbi:MAG: hypothetical protein OXC63_03765 [Aestuariivita sp.]|nr:hypothetical protein [Aestuariivita sp.]MCY4346978.1 hypothetical protein [Aestuariivita sp.]